MAEFGAHLTTAATEIPTIFEILAQDNLTVTLRPAFGQLVKAIAELNIDKLGFFYRWRDEIYTLIELLLQHFCLKSCGASFAEQFYGLRRIPIGESQLLANYILPRDHHGRSLLCLVVVPYLKLKLDLLFEKLQNKLQTCACNNKKNIDPKKAFTFVYPIFHWCWEILSLYYLVRYALGREDYPSPLYRFARTKLLTLAEGYNIVNPLVSLWKELRFISSWTMVPNVLYEHIKNNYRELFTASLSLSSFFLQALEWWYTAGHLVTVPVTLLCPPDSLKNTNDEFLMGKCPVCSNNLTNAVVLSTSGYRYCYPCIFHYVQNHGSCPVTKLPSTAANIVRLYSND